MTQIAALTLADGQATPANHTFSVAGVIDGVAKWEDRSGGIPIGYPTATFSLRRPAKGSQNYKIVAKVQLPVMEVTAPSTATGIQPAPTKAYDLFATVEFTVPARATAQNRSDLLAYVRNFLGNAAVIPPALSNFDPVW